MPINDHEKYVFIYCLRTVNKVISLTTDGHICIITFHYVVLLSILCFHIKQLPAENRLYASRIRLPMPCRLFYHLFMQLLMILLFYLIEDYFVYSYAKINLNGQGSLMTLSFADLPS